MSILNPLDLMKTLGTAPERQARKPRLMNGFQTHMNRAMKSGDIAATAVEMGGSAVDNALMQDALHGLASIMRDTPLPSRGKATKSLGKDAGIGAVSATFESGNQGVNAIGYDANGGTSYGTYQIASKPGTMQLFVQFLEDKAPDWAATLKAAGPANTGSTKGRMPAAWKKIADKAPEKFEQLQREFIETTHYEPARDKILARTGVDVDSLPTATREALWSTAVQHGPAGAAGIFGRAIKSIGKKSQGQHFAEKLISKVYDERKQHFGSSTPAVQTSVQGRMRQEKELVLAMLNPADRSNA